MNTGLNIKRAVLTMGSLLLLQALSAAAESSPWHLWESRIDGRMQCEQFSPGSGWVHMDGTFSDSRCRTAWNRSGGNAGPGIARKNRMLELMTIMVTARSVR